MPQPVNLVIPKHPSLPPPAAHHVTPKRPSSSSPAAHHVTPKRPSSSSPNAQARHPQLDWGSIYLDTNRAHRSQISLIRWVTLLILQALSRTAHTKNQSTRNAHLDTRSESGMTEREVCTHPLPGMTTFHYVIPDRLTVIPNRPASSSPT